MDTNRPFILVTGSSGLIGSAVCDRLRESYEVIALDRAGPPQPPEHVRLIEVDLVSEESVRAACDQAAFQCRNQLAAVIHLAAYYDFSGESSEQYEQVNVRGTMRLVGALRGIDVGQFLYASSMLVHAPTEPGKPITEDWPLLPTWDYPRSKVATETYLRDECQDMPLAILRIAGLYDAHCHSIPLAHQIQRIYERSITSKVFPGNLSHGQTFVHLDDVVEAIRLTVERRARLPPSTTLLIGEPDTMSYGDLQRAIAHFLHAEEWETSHIPKVMAKVGAWMQETLPLGEDPFIKPWMVDLADDHYEVDISRARTLLGWEPRQQLRQFLPIMLRNFIADPGRWYRDNQLSVPLHTVLGT
ncbi:MAG: NAD(P)-dependent oxidoreductase [Planctomycetes bacterium]|nr:NAD(P)-dependent oxidoreductase [Planctomycetota bacterium]